MYKEKDSGEMDAGDMARQLEEIKKAQSGSDRRVQELTAENQKLTEQLGTYKSGDAPEVKELRERESLLARQTAVMTKAIEGGMDPTMAVKLIANPSLDDDDRIELLAEVIKETSLSAKNEIVKKYGKTVTFTDVHTPSYEEMLKMSDHEIKRMGPAVDGIIDQELKNKSTTVRNRLWEVI